MLGFFESSVDALSKTKKDRNILICRAILINNRAEKLRRGYDGWTSLKMGQEKDSCFCFLFFLITQGNPQANWGSYSKKNGASVIFLPRL
jgi:hypothetical protein